MKTNTKPSNRNKTAARGRVQSLVRAPIDASTEKQLIGLDRDNLDTRDYWLLVNEDHVCLTRQRSGNPATEQMRIPRKHFNKLARWYVTGKVL